MNLIDSHQPFKYEFISGVSLSNEFHRSNQMNSSVDSNKERQVFHNKLARKQNQTSSLPPVVEQTGKRQLEIIGLEFGPKVSLNTNSSANQNLLTKNGNFSPGPRYNLSRVDQTMLQLPKRSTFMGGRKARENVLPRTWTSHVPFSSELTTSDKLAVVSSNRRANTSTQNFDDKSIMTQRTQTNPTLNSSITILKQMPTTLNNQISPRLFKKPQQPVATLRRDMTSVKLPTLLKRTPSSIVKLIPSAYIQDTSRLQIPSSTPTNRTVFQPTPVIPMYTPRRSVALITEQHHLPLIKDRMVKANLAQRASFKCKSPLLHRPDSSLSRSTTAVVTASQIQAKSHNPLKSLKSFVFYVEQHMEAGSLLNEAAQNRLKRLFYQLDTDKDGHLTYPQVQKCLPVNLPRAQQTFFRVLYDITSDMTYFGLKEFYATAVLIDMVAKQEPKLWNTFLDDVDFNYYRDDILELLDEFDSRYSPVTSTILYDNLVALIMNRTTNGKHERVTKELENLIPLIKTMKFTRLEFIAFIPAIIYIESCLDQGKPLFRFRENSILDLHMQRSLLN